MLAVETWYKLFEQSLNYRDFIASTLKELQLNAPHFSLGYFSQKSGIKSRSLLLDIKNSRRRITARNINLIAKGFELPSEFLPLFKFKVALEENDLIPEYSTSKIKLLYQKQLNSLAQKIFNTSHKDDSILKTAEWPIVYAALGNEQGATFLEILNRTNIPRLKLREILNQFKLKGFIEEVNHRYICIEKNMKLFYQLAYSDHYKNVYIDTVNKHLQLAIENFSSEESLFSLAFLTIDEKDLPHLRQKIQTLMREFVSENERPAGGKVATINLGMFLV